MNGMKVSKKESNSPALRQRKVKGAAAPSGGEKPREVGTKSGKISVLSQLTTPWLKFRYCIGFLMGLLACIGSILTYEKECTMKEYKFTGWLVVALAGLYFHETRPFKRF